MMPPERPGEVRFAKRLAWHDDDPVLIAPLTVAEAEERHRGSETYLLAARLPDGFLMTIDRDTNWDRLKPGAVPYLSTILSCTSLWVFSNYYGEPFVTRRGDWNARALEYPCT